MGTTRTAIETGSCTLAYVVAIEGYDNLLTSWSDTAAVITAWSGTGYSAALRGLRAPGEITQSIEPFRPRLEHGALSLVVHPDENDTFSKDVFATDKTSANHARITGNLDRSLGIVTVGSTSGWPASGSVYVGTEKMTMSSKTGTTFTVGPRGTPSPFFINGGTSFARDHRVSQVAGGSTSYPQATDYPRKWIGRWVGVWACRVLGGVVDTKAQSELIFAGRIADIQDGEGGTTTLALTDGREVVANTVLLRDQWSAAPAEGVELDTTHRITFTEWNYTDSTKKETTITVGTGGWIGTGRKTTDQIIDGINDFLQDAKNVSATLNLRWTCERVAGNGTSFRALYSGVAKQINVRIEGSVPLMGMMGYDVEGPVTDDTRLQIYETDTQIGTSLEFSFISDFPRSHSVFYTGGDQTITVENTTGTIVNNGPTVPEGWKTLYTTTTGTWLFVTFKKLTFLAKQLTATTYELKFNHLLFEAFDQTWPVNRVDEFGRLADNAAFVRITDIVPRLKQIILSREPSLKNYLLKTFASTGTSGHNHGTWDDYDRTMSLGIPWDLLGTNFELSCEALAERTASQAITVLIEKPTKFGEILLPELLLRNAHLVWKDGALIFTSPGINTATDATHTLTTSHKAAAPGSAHEDRPQTTRSLNTIITHLKVEYDRDLRGRYRRTLEIANEQSASDYGVTQPLTIKARNAITLGDEGMHGKIRSLIAELDGSILAFYSKPLPITVRSLPASKYFMTPGDSINLTDNYVRDVGTGARGISLYPAWLLSITQNWKTTEMRGSVSMVLHGDDSARRATYSPAAKLDENHASSENGYSDSTTTPSTANPTLYLNANEFSLSSEPDDWTHFDVGDLITIVERSPVTIGTPTTWARTISAKPAANLLELSSALSAPAWNPGKRYYVVAQPYGSATATQRTHSFVADDVDSQVVDTTRSFLWGTQEFFDLGDPPAFDTTERHEYPVDDGKWEDDGQPVTPSHHRNAVRTVTNLINRRTTPQMPMRFHTAPSTVSTTYVAVTMPVPCYVGNGLPIDLTRLLQIGATLSISNSASKATVRVTSSAVQPRGSSLTVPEYFGTKSQVEISLTGTTAHTNVAGVTLSPVREPGGAWTWITVELKTNNAAHTATFHGFHEWWLGALQ